MEDSGQISDQNLTPEQERRVIDVWNSLESPSLQEIGEKVFGSSFTTRSLIGKKLKKFIASRNIKRIESESNSGKIELTENQKTLIINNLSRLQNPIDLTQFIFPETQITETSPELLQVKKYITGIKKAEKFIKEDGVRSNKYAPPKTAEDSVYKVNKATFGLITKDRLSKDSNIKSNLTALVRFLNSFRFSLIYESYPTDIERELFETTFVKYTWDKPDLTEEEVDQYINLAQDIVSAYNLKKELEYITNLRDSVAEDSDGRKISMSLVESMAGIRKELDDNLKRQDRSINTLQGKRSNRIDTKIRENASILQIVEAWRTEEKRKRMLKLAKPIKENEKRELAILDSIESLKAEMWGVNPESFDYIPLESSTVKDPIQSNEVS